MKPICETCHKGIPIERFQGVALCEGCEKVVTRRLAAVEAERDEARNARDHYMDVWNEQCAHVREACEMLGVDPEQIAADSWTLRDYAARVYRWWIDAERADTEKAHRLAALGGELFAARERAEQADTTRREWEVRAATSYAAGRAAGLREAAAKLAELRDEWEVMMGDGSVAHNCGKIAHGHVIALAPPAVETVSHTITATSADGAKASPYMCDAPAAEPRDEGES